MFEYLVDLNQEMQLNLLGTVRITLPSSSTFHFDLSANSYPNRETASTVRVHYLVHLRLIPPNITYWSLVWAGISTKSFRKHGFSLGIACKDLKVR